MSACRGRPESTRLVITRRDRAVIADVAVFGAVTRAQLMESGHFGSVSRANRRLRLLTNHKYLRRTHVATGPHQNSTVYLIGPAGVEVAVEDCCLDPVELRRQSARPRERMFLEHHLGVLSLRLKAEQVSGDLRLVRFLAEPECRHEYHVDRFGKSVRCLVKPDAFVLFEDTSGLLATFIEFDRGNASLPQMAGMFRRYCSYWADTAFQAAYGITSPFAVAIITTAGQRRIDHLLGLIEPSEVQFIFTTFDQIMEAGFDAPIWSAIGVRQSFELAQAFRLGGNR